jgi:cytochrome d ubiquinol oxidase subunit II
MNDLALIWAFLLAFAVYAYVVLDGFDLGVGILAPFGHSEDEQDLMVSTIAPVWDGNETWLVFGGGGLMAAFPLAYSILLPAFYAPLFAMLLALIFRGVAFEFRHRNPVMYAPGRAPSSAAPMSRPFARD